jgi:hypothetical protein
MDNSTKEDPRKITAIATAVAAYIKTEEEALMAGMAGAGPAQPAAGGAAPQNLWGLSGRQNMMQLRSLMQLRAMTRFS